MEEFFYKCVLITWFTGLTLTNKWDTGKEVLLLNVLFTSFTGGLSGPHLY